MITNTLFSPARFINLCRKDMVENWKTNLIRIAALYGIMVILFVGKALFTYPFHSGDTDPVVNFSLNTLLVIGIVGGIIFASTMMDRMKSKTSRLSVLMTPVTPFENYLSRWLIYTVVYFVIIIIVYLLADYTRVLIGYVFFSDAHVVPASLKYMFHSGGPYYASSKSFTLGATLLQYFLFQSFFVLGASIWPKNSFIKTLLAGIFIVFSYTAVATLTVYIMYGDTSIQIQGENRLLTDYKILDHLNTIITLVFIIFNWVMGYYRFKESDLIN